MILTSCPECRRAVSDNARFCPYCGGAIRQAQKAGAADAPPAIRTTVGRLRGQLAVAIGLFWAGLLLASLAAPSVTSSSEPLSALALFMPLITGMMIFAGAMGYVVTKFRIGRMK